MKESSSKLNEYLTELIASETPISELLELCKEPNAYELLRLDTEPYTEELLNEIKEISDRTAEDIRKLLEESGY